MGTWVRVSGKIDIDLCTIYKTFVVKTLDFSQG